MVLEFFEWMEGSALSALFQGAIWYSPLILSLICRYGPVLPIARKSL